ncbi:MAG: SHOCT domain-containing protein [Salipiger thiooxidans]|jgi:putative membrane protein|uniref:SHOCT domain-containing protein n=1 Tax=Salipiger thiooxidans TaxID=282683 RepID=UPI001A8E8AC8|nr:hypothetical protein [Salipiger thiooxidans]MBN8189042.1 hypothetical protein [Salipiger thiooxidans]MBR9839060.1 hypothetical protein [Paracoccaceae bacterium]
MKRLIVLLSVLGQPVLADQGDYYGHMMDFGYGHSIGMMFGPVLWLIVLGLVVAGIIWLVRRTDGGAVPKTVSDARAELDMRFARGEIDTADYEARKKLLTT